LERNVDIVAVHLLPYWEGISVQNSLGFLQRSYANVQQEFPDKADHHWRGGLAFRRPQQAKCRSLARHEAYFLRGFVQLAMEKGYDYYLMEGYDQPWKANNEGAVGAYWGVFDAEGIRNSLSTGLLRTFPQWRTYALVRGDPDVGLGLVILARCRGCASPAIW